jgi:hypothetical protein
MFGKFDEDKYLNDDDGSLFGLSDRYEERKAKLELAKEIASGITSGLFVRDEEVWDLVKKIQGE